MVLQRGCGLLPKRNEHHMKYVIGTIHSLLVDSISKPTAIGFVLLGEQNKQKQKQNIETILKRFRIVLQLFKDCFCFISHVTMSEIKLKRNFSVSVLFRFYFRCNHCIMILTSSERRE